MIFRARLTRASRGTLCGALAVGFAWALHTELTFDGIDGLLRAIAAIPTAVMEIAFLLGLWRLWVVCLIVDESGVVVRNFRGDIRLRRSEIGKVITVTGFAGCHVALRLKTGDDLHLDGLAFASRERTDRAVAEIDQVLALVSPRAEP
ncbi:MAG TPA: hypothetical protein VHE57_00800 [Mycobacteriales bacterium]|nr:hypothetical protein [Mycobacteriales bacterium]